MEEKLARQAGYRKGRKDSLLEFRQKLLECKLDKEWNAGPLFDWIKEQLEK